MSPYRHESPFTVPRLIVGLSILILLLVVGATVTTILGARALSKTASREATQTAAKRAADDVRAYAAGAFAERRAELLRGCRRANARNRELLGVLVDVRRAVARRANDSRRSIVDRLLDGRAVNDYLRREARIRRLFVKCKDEYRAVGTSAPATPAPPGVS